MNGLTLDLTLPERYGARTARVLVWARLGQTGVGYYQLAGCIIVCWHSSYRRKINLFCGNTRIDVPDGVWSSTLAQFGLRQSWARGCSLELAGSVLGGCAALYWSWSRTSWSVVSDL